MPLTSTALADGLGRVAGHLEAVAEDLNAADALIGDGDLGVSLTRIARAMRDVLPDLPDDVGQAFLKCVQAVTKVSGSSYATLLASALMSAAKATRGRREVPWSEVAALLDGASQAVQARGKAAQGDKTVIDAIAAAAAAADGKDDPLVILDAARNAVDEAIDQFRDLPNKVGRARIWADKSIGLDDPGMLAFKQMLEGLRS